MAPQLPVWLHRLPVEVRRRLELAEAAAREARYQTHAEQAVELVAVLAPRLPFDEALRRYIVIMDLAQEDAEIVRNRALVRISESEIGHALAKERHRLGWGLDWRYATPLGAVRFVQRHLRRNAEEDLWLELAAARAEEALILIHIKYALIFADLLDTEAAPPQSVSYYLDRLEVPSARAFSTYQRALAAIAAAKLPRLLDQRAEE
jgi:hypothetical protein